MEGSDHGLVKILSRHLLKGPDKTTKVSIKIARLQSWDLNPGALEYETGILRTLLRRFATNLYNGTHLPLCFHIYNLNLKLCPSFACDFKYADTSILQTSYICTVYRVLVPSLSRYRDNYGMDGRGMLSCYSRQVWQILFIFTASRPALGHTHRYRGLFPWEYNGCTNMWIYTSTWRLIKHRVTFTFTLPQIFIHTP
jgi:hypothetical protein